MYDLRHLRDNLDLIRTSLGHRGADVAWDDLRKAIDDRRQMMTQVEQLRHELRKDRTKSPGSSVQNNQLTNLSRQ